MGGSRVIEERALRQIKERDEHAIASHQKGKKPF
jgi:hypothetical protein